jgi:catechol 2,3-dioxygenase-like lactoylglutathione lyase family enzyme
MEEDGEERAREFYGGVLGLTEVQKPAALAARGGCWFVGEGIHLHLGVERPFRPQARAHVALLADDLDAARDHFDAAGIEVTDDDSGVGFARFYVRDPFGNRIEIVAARDAGFTARSPQLRG